MSLRTLGKYVLRDRIGRGGMAEVYQAYQPGLERLVAVKLMHPHLAETPDFLLRFQREAQSVSALRHPHIVQVFDFDVAGDQPYMVMEYVDGASLKTILDERFARGEKLELAEVLRWFDDLLDAVEYAHAHGMIHRDLKPANVLLDKTGRVVLTDFGIARLVSGERLTQTGITLGSPAYMSPEQGQGEPADERTDIYALGIMLFECLAGQVPFEGETSVAVLLKHASAPVPSLVAARPELPPALDDILRIALAKQPKDRYQSAAALALALHSLLPASITAPARPAPAAVLPAPAAVKPAATTAPRRRPGRRALLLGAVLVLAATLAVLGALVGPRWYGAYQAGQALQTAQTRLAAGDYQLAADAFTRALAAEPQNTAALAGRAQAYEALQQIDDALADLDNWIKAAPEAGLAYAERARLSVTYQTLDDPAAVLADLDRAVQLAPDSARAHFLRGWAILNFPLINNAADPAAALADLRQAVTLTPDDAEAQFTLAQALLAAGQAPDALAPAGRAVELAPHDASHWELRAHLHALQGDFLAAIDDLSGALKAETEPVAQATYLAERAYLRWRLKSAAAAAADARQAVAVAPGSDLAAVTASLVSGSAPDPAQLKKATQLAPADDPIWLAILHDLSR